MQWTVDYDGAMEVIRVAVSGDFSAQGLKAMTIDLLDVSRRHDNYRVLCDCRHANLGMEAPEIYRNPNRFRELGLMSYHVVALVHSSTPEAANLFSVLEERCQNSGLSMKAFTDYSNACLWLTGVDWSTNSNPSAAIA